MEARRPEPVASDLEASMGAVSVRPAGGVAPATQAAAAAVDDEEEEGGDLC
jgi:hypothetical protein